MFDFFGFIISIKVGLVEKDRFSFILPKVNTQLFIHKPVTYVGEVLSEIFFYLL